ncbi:zinc ABC transporter substrate-binding protein [Halovulum dunhuangense]|uniref:High-affinity zinc uptake system protein ZnuA n=1 Tax=Halovulum dunhuangense TaxID=1505036 RepID=A0A849KVR8_9RHOB|nr:metal ABC transporter substrate-binding protein [Halovulum dunhuangense]NNU79205.1 zinc ABC transporter substrate-binding protein [Halovulum dunhuangense]
MKRIALTIALLALSGPAQADGPRIAAVSGPLADWAATLAGDAAEVVYPVPEGVDPMFWRPAIADISTIQSADLILLNGAGFAQWTAKVSLPRARTIVTSAAFEGALIEIQTGVTHSHGAEGEHSHTGTAPQTWLDFGQAKAQVEATAQGLNRVLPGEADAIAANAAALIAELDALDQRAASLGAQLEGRTVFAAVPGLEYFDRAYGIGLVTLGWDAGNAATDAEWAALDAQLATATAPLFLWQEAPSDAAAVALSGRGVPFAVIDPGTAATQGFIARMQGNLDSLESALAGQ